MASPALCFVCGAYRMQCFGFLQNSLTNGAGHETLKLWSSHKCAVCSLRCKLCDFKLIFKWQWNWCVYIHTKWLFVFSQPLVDAFWTLLQIQPRQMSSSEGITTREICYTSTLFITILPILPRWHIFSLVATKLAELTLTRRNKTRHGENSDP